MEKWDVVIRLRQDVNAVLEAARAAKRISKALEAHVSLEAQDDAAGAALEAVRTGPGGDLHCLQLRPGAGAGRGHPGPGGQFPRASELASPKPKGAKCPRRWMHSLQANEEGLCPRCAGSSPDCPRMLWN